MSSDPTQICWPRKGARAIRDIPEDVRRALNAGETPTVNLVEFLAIDLPSLLSRVLEDSQIPLAPDEQAGLEALYGRLPTLKPMQRHPAIARFCAQLEEAAAVFCFFSQHSADLPRQWAALMVGVKEGQFGAFSFAERLHAIHPFADDAHFAVREMAWLSLREAVIENLTVDPEKTFELLFPWCHEASPNIRRFVSELTRPQGVWCAHIPFLKAHPEWGLPILDTLRADESRYVQNSVANWLNDAGKSRPEWVRALCAHWKQGSAAPATAYICRRALRSIPQET